MPLPLAPWRPGCRCNDYSSPAGDFAEVFATWLVGPGDFRGRLRPPPSARELQQLTPLFRVPAPSAPAAPAAPAAEPATEDDPAEQGATLPPLPGRPGPLRG